MKIFVWKNTRPVTGEYHDEGGLLIIEEDLESARNAWYQRKYYYEGPSDTSAVDKPPDHTWETPFAAVGTVIVFPDSGCC